MTKSVRFSLATLLVVSAAPFLLVPSSSAKEKVEFHMGAYNQDRGWIEHPDGTISSGGNNIQLQQDVTVKGESGRQYRQSTVTDLNSGDSTTMYTQGKRSYSVPARTLDVIGNQLCFRSGCYFPDEILWTRVGNEIVGCKPGETLETKGNSYTCNGLTDRPANVQPKQNYGQPAQGYRRMPPSQPQLKW